MLSSFNALSLEKYVLDADVAVSLRAALHDVPVGEDDLAEDTIAAVGPAGGYLGRRTRGGTHGISSGLSRRQRRRPSPSTAGSRRAAKTPSPPPPAASRSSSPRTSRRTTSTR